MVSVVVPHYQDLASLALCLDALGRQTYPKERFEIVVGDNNSPAGLAAVQEIVAARARVVVVPEKGAGPARNGAAAVAVGDVLAFTDSDCLPDPDWLRAGVAALSDCDFVGGRMRVLAEDEDRVTPTEAFEKVFAFNNEDYVTRKGFSVTANLFCRGALFQKVGGFRTHVSEDLDWSHRARDAGYVIGYGPEAVVWHPARRTLPSLLKKWRRLNRESFELYKAQRWWGLQYGIRVLALPLSILIHAPRVIRSPALDGAGQRWGALRTLVILRLWRFFDSLSIMAAHAARRLKSAK